MSWYFAVLKKYADFSGRASRTEFWMFTLFNLIIAAALFFGEVAVGGPGIIGWLYILAILLPSWAVAVRRLHDTNKSGWWLLIAIIPLGNLVLFFFFFLASTHGTNKYGANPWGEGNERSRTSDQRLGELDSLRAKSLISEDEYQEKRREVLRQL